MKASIFKITLSICALFVAAVACRDDEEFRHPDFGTGPNMRIQIDPTSSYYNYVDPSTATLGFDMYSENAQDIDNVLIRVRYQKAGNPSCANRGCTGPFDVRTYEGSDIGSAQMLLDQEITLAELATVVGVPVSQMKAGDQFWFEVYTTMTDGRVYPGPIVPQTGQDNTPGIFDQPGSSLTTNFSTFIGCPYVPADVVGTYTIVQDEFGGAVAGHNTVTVENVMVPGVGTAPATVHPTNFIIRNVLGHATVPATTPATFKDLTLTGSTANGFVSSTRQNIFTPAYFLATNPARGAQGNNGFGQAVAGNGSFVATCTGEIYLRMSYSYSVAVEPSIYTLKLVKQ